MTDPITAARQMADAYQRESMVTARIAEAFAVFADRMAQQEQAEQPEQAEPSAPEEATS